MADLSSLSELLAMGAGGGGVLVLAIQQFYRKFKANNSIVQVDSEVSGGTIEIIKLLREQNAVAAENNKTTTAQYEILIASNALRYKELLVTNDHLYQTINELQLKVNDLNAKIGQYQLDNQKLSSEINTLDSNNRSLSDQVSKLTTEIHNFRRGVT